MARPRKENADYFSHDTNMRSHRKVIALRSKFGITGYAIYSMLLEHIASCDFFKAKYNDIELEILAGDFGVESSLLGDIISFCDRLGLIQKIDGYIECESMLERLQDLIKKRDRERSREKPKDEEGKFVSVTETHSNDTGMPQSKVKESKVKEIKENNIKEDIYKEETTSKDVPVKKRSIINQHNKKGAIEIYDKIKEMCVVVDGSLDDCVVLRSKLENYGTDPVNLLEIMITKMRDTGLNKFYSVSNPGKLADHISTIVEKLKSEKPKKTLKVF